MKVLCVDGPWQGKLMDIDDNTRTWVVPVPLSVPLTIREAEQFEPNFDTAEYRIHHVPMFGELVVVGSVRDNSPLWHDMFVLLASDKAKAVIRI